MNHRTALLVKRNAEAAVQARGMPPNYGGEKNARAKARLWRRAFRRASTGPLYDHEGVAAKFNRMYERLRAARERVFGK